MGASVFAGFVVMLLMIPINAVIASISRKFQVSVVYTCEQYMTLFLGQLWKQERNKELGMEWKIIHDKN